MLPFKKIMFDAETGKLNLFSISSIINGKMKYHLCDAVNMNGEQTNNYFLFLDICDVISNCCFHHLTTYSFKAKNQGLVPHACSILNSHLQKCMLYHVVSEEYSDDQC